MSTDQSNAAPFDLDLVPHRYRDACRRINTLRAINVRLGEMATQAKSHFEATGEGEEKAKRLMVAWIDGIASSIGATQRLLETIG